MHTSKGVLAVEGMEEKINSSEEKVRIYIGM
jgi:hypothetical protein